MSCEMKSHIFPLKVHLHFILKPPGWGGALPVSPRPKSKAGNKNAEEGSSSGGRQTECDSDLKEVNASSSRTTASSLCCSSLDRTKCRPVRTWGKVSPSLSLTGLQSVGPSHCFGTFWSSLAPRLLDQMLDVHMQRRTTRPPSFQSAASSLQPRCSAPPRQQRLFHKLCFSFQPSVHFQSFQTVVAASRL